jgi:WhiB family redox-sensing transcriptional regulator
MNEHWRASAACRGKPCEWWFDHGMGRGVTYVQQRAIAICMTCPVRAECLHYAISNGETGGIWGGLIPEHRIHLRVA